MIIPRSALVVLFALCSSPVRVRAQVPVSVEVAEGVAVASEGLRQGLELRIEDMEGWTVRVGRGADPSQVEVWLRRPDGSAETRTLPLVGSTDEDRARAMAAELALVIDQWEAPAEAEAEAAGADAGTGPAPGASVGPAFLLGGGGLLVGRSEVVAAGPRLGGGARLLGDRLMVRLDMGWSLASRGDLRLHGLRIAPGIGVGHGWLDGRVWLGGIASPGLDLLVATERDRRVVPGLGGALTGLLQLRPTRDQRLLLEFRGGLDLRLPPARIEGQSAVLRWRPVAWTSVLSVGVTL